MSTGPTAPPALAAWFAPWRQGRVARALAHVSLDIVIGTITFSIIFTLLVTATSIVLLFPLAAALVWVALEASHVMARGERARFAALLDVALVDPQPEFTATSWWGRAKEQVRSPHRWRELGYCLALLPLGLVTSVGATTVWAIGPVLVAAPLLTTGTHLAGHVVDPWFPWALVPVGIVVIAIVAPWSTVALARLDAVVGRTLLGTSERRVFEERVTTLESQRIRAVDSAEAERRRIERDLHDGAQQRLIAVAMQLGVARQRLDDDPASARALVDDAHTEVKSALKELRDLVRGIHPVILQDRGLDAALSAVVARTSVPVNLRVDLPARPPAAVESAAYFIVSEALVNVVRHAQAHTAGVAIDQSGGRLRITVTDDGVGGATLTGGSGLAGLADRVAALDGTLDLSSPTGGPTRVEVTIPCAS